MVDIDIWEVLTSVSSHTDKLTHAHIVLDAAGLLSLGLVIKRLSAQESLYIEGLKLDFRGENSTQILESRWCI